jgi:membrane protein implicated in regulation of membrane protease activity
MIFLGIPPLWGWLGFGLALIALEVVVAPGSYLLWIGLAALAMAGITFILPFTAGTEAALFGLLALGSGLLGWKVYGARTKGDAASDLHDLGGSLIGREFVLAQPIANGAGQVRVGDTVWRATGADRAAGEKVRVLRVDGATLIVEPA